MSKSSGALGAPSPRPITNTSCAGLRAALACTPRRSADGNVLLTGGTELILALLRFMNTTMAQSPRPARLQLHPAFDRRPRWVRGVCAEAGRVVAYLPLLSTPSHSL